MKTHLAQLSLLATLFIMGCKKDKGTIPYGNLITNSSFESSGQSSFQGWSGHLYSFVNDVPTNGGQWSLQLEPGWVPEEGFAETFVTGFSGTYSFKLTCDTKTIYWDGQIILRLENQNGTITDLTDTIFSNSTWSTITLNTNISLQQSDKLIVHLSAGGSEVTTGYVLFDNVRLERM